MKSFLLSIFILITVTLNAQKSIDYVDVSKNLLQNIMNKTSYEKEVNILANSSLNNLVNQLNTDSQKIAFWVNVYNSYIQISLAKNPDLYKDRSSFFSKPQIKIAGTVLSFDDIEHGIIRKSKVKISLGYMRKWFRAKWERKLRVNTIDWRIHFALNCGAKSCPPVAIYSSENLNKELDFMTQEYLKEQTTFNKNTETANTTVLFSWFRADFGGLNAIKQILLDYKITPIKSKKINFKEYDWTLLLDNFKTLPKN